MIFRRERQSTLEQNDATSLAGWVFADLLLSLSIIFLTSISFDTPGSGDGTTGSGPGTNGGAQSVVMQPNLDSTGLTEPSSEGLTFSYSAFDKEILLADIQNYRLKKGMSGKYKILYAQLIGGYDSVKEGSEQGSVRAAKFLIDLHKANIDEFSETAFDVATSENVLPNQILLRMTFTN